MPRFREAKCSTHPECIISINSAIYEKDNKFYCAKCDKEVTLKSETRLVHV